MKLLKKELLRNVNTIVDFQTKEPITTWLQSFSVCFFFQCYSLVPFHSDDSKLLIHFMSFLMPT